MVARLEEGQAQADLCGAALHSLQGVLLVARQWGRGKATVLEDRSNICLVYCHECGGSDAAPDSREEVVGFGGFGDDVFGVLVPSQVVLEDDAEVSMGRYLLQGCII